MNKRAIAEGLKAELNKGYDTDRISKWAYHTYSENITDLDPSLKNILNDLSVMDMDPQFELSMEELMKRADDLLREADEEELGNSLPEIKETATDLGDHWVMCPLCQEAWENHLPYPMLRCPKCLSLLHIPKK